ncbi:glutathione S-transferase family protein [Sphingopyxis sp. OPL5]|uniref:glutathione S-transferase family protein n=1 Tax=Sphingopyxis sp. OPL5 TaxID=2486273 RepID=UPI00164D1E7E|nr:glutathione S-transferase family protein [Sphingopyxis sp. OPL5]QNO29056.1 glutathione S-transferase family protein [Sphingopyxis sp. OPL5]
MSAATAALPEITAYRSVPDFARGRIKDIRARWALDEIGQPYRTRLIGGIFEDKAPAYLADQPFGQVPVYKDGDLTLFETGSILIHIGEADARLLPRDAKGRGRAISWMIAALNSVEPMIQTLVVLTVKGQGTDWLAGAIEAAKPFAEQRLSRLSQALGDRDWLEDRFSIGDIVMVDVLRNANPELLAPYPNLSAYVARGKARPAFQSAMAAHLADCAIGEPLPA